MALQDVSQFDFDSDDDSVNDRIVLPATTPHRPSSQIEQRDNGNIFLTQPACCLITREKLEHCVENYELSAPVQDRLHIAETPRRRPARQIEAIQYMGKQELNKYRKQIFQTYEFLPEKYNLNL